MEQSLHQSETMPAPSIKRQKFYKSKAWKRARDYKRKLEHGICEECGKAGWEVHHIIPLTDENVDDPEISLGLDNLMLLCTSCHNKKREGEGENNFYQVRGDVSFDEHGNTIIRSK